MTTAYVAHPIDQASVTGRSVILNAIRNRLHEAGINSFWPALPWDLPDPADAYPAIQRVNRAAHFAADVLIAYLPAQIASLGVPAEIERSLLWGQPVVLVTDLNTVQIDEWVRLGAGLVPQAGIDQLVGVILAAEIAAIGTGPPGLMVRTDNDDRIPVRGYESDAGYDCFIHEDCELVPGEYRDIPCGFDLGFPDGVWGLLIGRSSTAQRGLVVNTVVIDQGYAGPMYVGVTNVSNVLARVRAGERLAQVVPMPMLAGDVGIQRVDRLPETDRGSNGRGSTGN